MIFNTWVFAAFALASLALFWTVPKRLRLTVLVGTSTVFYAYSYPPYLLLIGALAAVTYCAARAIQRYRKEGAGAAVRWWLVVGVAASVGALFYYKYAKLFVATLDTLGRGHVHLTPPDLLIPLAISFFTFEFVHFLVDVYLGKIEDFSLAQFITFTLFYPTLVAGPIKRFQNFAPQIGYTRGLSQIFIAANVYRVLLGLAKKSIVADSMTPFVQPLLTPGLPYHTGDYWVGVLAYTAKIYFDFTGYSDIAIGMAGLLGFQILENFDRPYWAENISLFWRRWHISLSSWIRDYIFIPLGGSRRGAVLTTLNLALVMALAGLWHGAAWHFVLWGLWHGVGLAVHRVWGMSRAKAQIVAACPPRLLAGGSIMTTFAFVAVGWVLFAAPSADAIAADFAGMFGGVS